MSYSMMMSAVISDCTLYRYELVRVWDKSLSLLSIVMVNPSTADHTKNDQTIVKVMGFARLLGYGGIIVVNLFAFRATDVNELKTAVDPVGRQNIHYIFCAMVRTPMTLVAWGASSKLPHRLRDQWRKVSNMAHMMNRTLYCLGTCNDGHPKHPLTLPYNSQVKQWSY